MIAEQFVRRMTTSLISSQCLSQLLEHIDLELDGKAPVHTTEPAVASDKVEKGGAKEWKTKDEEVLSRLGSFASCLISGARYI